MIKTIGVIPSRYDAVRLPGKPLKLIKGKYLIQRVWEQVRKARALDAVIVATDDNRIKDAMEKLGATVYMTSPGCQSGTDRVNEAAMKFGKDAGIVLNIQGDEPLMDPATIDGVALALKTDKKVVAASACYRFKKGTDLENPNDVKVVLDKNSFALYFSRYPIPYDREGRARTCFKHLGIYGFRREFLSKFASLEQTPLELSEKLEQLRILENGFKIKMIISKKDSIGVDEKSDIARVERFIKG
jgi:3-deoxy-manno-octulosonate cytidylyltransferase (CMP-KDO synthetase)